jgi:alanine racemase
MTFFQYIRHFKKRLSNRQPLIRVKVIRKNILHNFNEFKKVSPIIELAPVLKSNAYGHGLINVAQILAQESLSFFCLDSLFEAWQLYHSGIKKKILILGYVRPEEICHNCPKNLSFTIVALEQLEYLSKNLSSPRLVHLKIDTGMHRQGILIDNLSLAKDLIRKNNNIILEGICSHLADADNQNTDKTIVQIRIWNRVVDDMQMHFPKIKYFHISSTSGFCHIKKINANVLRLGIGLYGYDVVSTKELDLKPALTMNTIITSVKEIDTGDAVGYNFTFQANHKMKVATIPIGYFEGVDRRLSNVGFVKIGTEFCPIIGRVSMNITTIDVTDVLSAMVGDEVMVISSDKDAKNSIKSIAKTCQTIPYEILVHIPVHLKREIV